MANDGPGGLPPGLAERLQALRGLYVAERDDEARRRLARERPRRSQPFEVAVAGRLRELRALCELAEHLHRVPIQRK